MAKRWRPSAAPPDLVQALGTDVDGVIARRFRLTESQIGYLRSLHRIPAYRRPGLSAEQRALVMASLRPGATLSVTAHALDLGYATVSAVARAHGWRRGYMDGRRLRRRKQRYAAITRAELLDLYRSGMAMRLIGQRAGITSERVRQIIQEEGLPPRLPVLRQARERRRAQQREQRQIAARRRQDVRAVARHRREQRLRRFLLRARRLWRQGATIAAIAVAYRMPSNSMSWYIHSGRTRFGWFPRRA